MRYVSLAGAVTMGVFRRLQVFNAMILGLEGSAKRSKDKAGKQENNLQRSSR